MGVWGEISADTEKDFRTNLTKIHHRGPDSSGVFISPKNDCILGHQRLSIVELSELGHQPMLGSKWVLTYNGEIYNHEELRLPEHSYRSKSDTETLLVGFEKQGFDSLRHWVGMFAGAFYNQENGSLFLFRDSLGIKPLYYAIQGTQVYFASEAKAILPFLDARIDVGNLNSYLRFENYGSDQTLFTGIKMVPPGTGLQFEKGDLTPKVVSLAYQKGVAIQAPTSKEEVSAFVESHVRKSVKAHLMSDHPLGVYVSGGIDSTLVAALASESAQHLIGYTGYFSEPGVDREYYDERGLARLVCQKFKIEHVEVEITPEIFQKKFDQIIFHLDEPRMGMGSFSQYVVAEEVSKTRRVVLTGHGGDELFWGYTLFKALALASKKSTNRWQIFQSFRGKEMNWLLFVIKNKILGKAFGFAPEIWNRSVSSAQNDKFQAKSWESGIPELEKYYREVYLPGLLVVEDKISMAHSLESRTPLWSQELQVAMSLVPDEFKLGLHRPKPLLWEFASKILPPEILNAPKRGFPTPLRNWFRTSLKKFVSERLLEASPDFYRVFDKAELKSLLWSHDHVPLPFALDEIRAHRIWTALCVESWMRSYQVKL